MREILFRGKRVDNGEWVHGHYANCTHPRGQKNHTSHYIIAYPGNPKDYHEIYTGTVDQYTGLTDKNGAKIFEGDIVRYNTYNDFDCHSVVKFGEYEQDGSDGEYSPSPCVGLYVEVDNFTCPDWAENDPIFFRDYLKTQNLLEVSNECEVIGNIHDNPELL